MSVVKQTRILFSTKDILAMRIRCRDCDGETLYSLGKQKVPSNCAACGKHWPSTDNFYNKMHALLEYTKYLRDSDASSPLDLIYEIDGNEADEAPEAAENT